MWLVWRDVEMDEERLAALNAVAADVPYIGHSASLTRCRFRGDGEPQVSAPARRRVYPGRISELERTYDAGRRPRPGEPVPAAPDVRPPPKRSVFSDHWLVLEQVTETPDLRAAALVAKAIRCALMSGYRSTGMGAAIPAAVSGHAPNGSPLADPHLAVAPLAFLGTQFADARVYGFALIPPGKAELLENAEFQSAVRQIAKWNDEEDRRDLKVSVDGFALTLTPTRTRNLRSLEPTPYVAAAKTWATCTPIVLDRHLKAKTNAARDEEVCELVAHACVNIGLPMPARVVAGKHSAIAGAPSAYPSGGAPRWTGWRLPKSIGSRQLTHAVIQFDERVRGPLLLGAGRFIGLGMCRALDARRGNRHDWG